MRNWSLFGKETSKNWDLTSKKSGIMGSQQCPARAGVEVSQIGNHYRKKMAYRKIFEMQKHRSRCEVHQRIST